MYYRKLLPLLLTQKQKVINFPKISSMCDSSKCDVKKAIVFQAEGYEETEFVTIVDVLRRGGVRVQMVGLKPGLVKGSHDIRICSDIDISQVKGVSDALILPGGVQGAKNLASDACVGQMLQEQEKACRIVAAVCAGPTALKAHGVGKGKKVTSYPAMKKEMTEGGEYTYCDEDVVVDEYLITGRGPALAMKFALAVLEKLSGEKKMCEVAEALLFKF